MSIVSPEALLPVCAKKKIEKLENSLLWSSVATRVSWLFDRVRTMG